MYLCGMKRFLSAFYILMLMAIGNAAGQLCGSVVDSGGEPMPYVTVAALAADSSVMAGTVTSPDGAFSLQVPPAAKGLQFSYMGCSTLFVPSDSLKQNMRIMLREEATHLSELTVRADKALIERKMDKIVVNVANSTFAIGNNGKDILKKAPGVHIDRKGKITVNGKAVEVYVDGRPTYLSGAQLKTMLEATDGSVIDKLEIITQPSAKFDAAGQGGIINIKTRRNLSKGINGSLSGSYGGMYWRNLKAYMQDEHFSANLNYRASRSYTSMSLSESYSDRTESFSSFVQSLDEQRTTESEFRTATPHVTLKLSHDYYIDSLNTLGFIFSAPFNTSLGKGPAASNNSQLVVDDVIRERTSEEVASRERWIQHTANLNYTHIFSDSLERELTLNFDYNRRLRSDSRSSLVRTDFYDGVESAEQVNQSARHIGDILSARIDFQTAFWQTGTIECGAKWLSTNTLYSSDIDTLMGGSQRADFRYTEHVGALYLTMGKLFGDHWSAKLGLRGEQTISRGQWLAADSVSRKHYFNLFPTAFIAYMPTEDWSISLDYNRRIERPHYDMLDPTVHYEDAHSVRVGNTELMPAFTHNLLCSFAYSEYVSLDFEFGHTRDWMDYRTTVLSGGERLQQAVNIGTNNSHGIYLSLTELPIVPKLSARDSERRRQVEGAWLALTCQLGGMREHFSTYDGLLELRHWSMNLYAELSAYLPHDYTVSLDGFYSTPGIWGAEQFSAWKELNLALKKDFPDIGLTLTARVNDIALSSRWSSVSLGLPEGYANSYSGTDAAHMLTLGLVYKFGSQLNHRRLQEADVDVRESRSGSRKGRR